MDNPAKICSINDFRALDGYGRYLDKVFSIVNPETYLREESESRLAVVVTNEKDLFLGSMLIGSLGPVIILSYLMYSDADRDVGKHIVEKALCCASPEKSKWILIRSRPQQKGFLEEFGFKIKPPC